MASRYSLSAVYLPVGHVIFSLKSHMHQKMLEFVFTETPSEPMLINIVEWTKKWWCSHPHPKMTVGYFLDRVGINDWVNKERMAEFAYRVVYNIIGEFLSWWELKFINLVIMFVEVADEWVDQVKKPSNHIQYNLMFFDIFTNICWNVSELSFWFLWVCWVSIRAPYSLLGAWMRWYNRIPWNFPSYSKTKPIFINEIE